MQLSTNEGPNIAANLPTHLLSPSIFAITQNLRGIARFSSISNLTFSPNSAPPDAPHPLVVTHRPPSQQALGTQALPTSHWLVTLHLSGTSAPQSMPRSKQTPALLVSSAHAQVVFAFDGPHLLEWRQSESHLSRVQTPLVQSKPSLQTLPQEPQF